MMLRRMALLMLFVVLLVLAAAGLFSYRYWIQWQQANGIERLDWAGVSLGKLGLEIDSLELVQAQGEQKRALSLKQLQLRWQFHWQGKEQDQDQEQDQAPWPGLQMETVSVSQLEFVWPRESPSSNSATPELHSAIASLENALNHLVSSNSGAFWLPSRINIEQLQGQIPCADAVCSLSAQVALQRAEDLFPVSVQASLYHNGHTLFLEGDIDASAQQLSLTPVDVELKISSDDKRLIHLQSNFSGSEPGQATNLGWTGEIQISDLTRGSWLWSWLGQWMTLPVSPVDVQEFGLSWDLGWPQQGEFLNNVQGTGSLHGKVDRFSQDNIHVQGIDLDLNLEGQLVGGNLEADLIAGSSLSLSQMEIKEKGSESTVKASGISADLEGVHLQAGVNFAQPQLTDLSLAGPFKLNLNQLNQAAVNPLGWQLRGQFQADTNDLQLEGKLSWDAEAKAKVSLHYGFESDLEGSVNWYSNGVEAHRVLSQTLVDWPDLLSLEQGDISATLLFRKPLQRAFELEGKVRLERLDGTYDRTAWNGLSSGLQFRLLGSQLELELNELELSKINPGIALGPIRGRGSYQANLDNLLAGRLQVREWVVQIAGGTVQLDPGVWHTQRFPLRARLRVNQLQLEQLLALYPTDGVAGSGVLNGQLPLSIVQGGVVIAEGKVAADSRGGTLRISPQQLKSLGQGNKAMAQVVAALDNFHFTVLNSTVDYNQEGILTLGLHLEGQNPELENKQRYNFNISLEDDIPALLTSLQLSGRVSDAVAERVKRLLEKDGSSH